MVGEIPADFIIAEKSGKTKLAPERFANAGEVADICNALVSADRRRAPWRTAIDGLFDGNPAYRLSSLKAKGQGFRARVNYQEMSGLINARQTPLFDLVTEVDPCVEIILDYGSGDQSIEWANKMAKRFHCMFMKQWRSSFNYHIPLQQLELLKHGIGCHIWPDRKNCWIPRTPMAGNVLFPDGVSLNLEEDLDYFMLRDFLPGHVLYGHIRNEETAGKLGWNVDTVWKALAQTSKNQSREGGGGNRYTVEEAQREYKAGDIGTSNARQSGLWLDHLFVKEIGTGNISQYTVAEGVTVSGKDKSSGDPWRNCLFRKRDRFEKWPIVIFPYDVGSGGRLHSVRGLGARTKDFFELSNRLYNAMVDQVLIGSLLTVKQTGQVDPDKLKLMRLGMMNILPQGIDLQTGTQFQPLAQGPIALQAELKNTLRTNNQSNEIGAPEPMDRETAESWRSRNQDSGQVSKGAHSLYSSNWQLMIDHIVRTACRPDATQGNSLSAKLAKEFQDGCILEDKVPKEALTRLANGKGEINEVFSTGAGSPSVRINNLLTAFKYLYPTTTEARKINIERDFASALFSGSKVDRYARSHEDNNLPDEDASLAVVENNGLMTGGDALVSSQQDHVEHLNQHIPKAQEVVQAVMQGQMDPAQALSIIQKFGSHMASHLKFLQQNPMRKAEFDAFYAEWTALSVIADKLQQQISAAAAAEPQRPPEEKVSDDLKIGLARVAVDEKVGMAKVASQGRIDVGKLAIDSRIKAAQASRNGKEKEAA